ncbi:DUF3265 domain-containing protein [Vibrio kanaloae]|nr:DUF3265 domain-containing protein [Vibrio parahaemolyticus]KAB0464958.1 DUF3265 domain-containing protein [Vibrio kanaloae]
MAIVSVGLTLQWSLGNSQLTRRLRRIPNAWHFWFDSALVFTAQWFRSGGSVAHHLTRR